MWSVFLLDGRTKPRNCSEDTDCVNRACCLSSTSPFSQGCQMAKFGPFLSLDCARVESVGAQSKERKGSNFAV